MEEELLTSKKAPAAEKPVKAKGPRTPQSKQRQINRILKKARVALESSPIGVSSPLGYYKTGNSDGDYWMYGDKIYEYTLAGLVDTLEALAHEYAYASIVLKSIASQENL